MNVAVTGSSGFLGWHLRVRLRAARNLDAIALGQEHFAHPDRLVAALEGVDTLIHLAGVNRAADDDAVEEGNVDIARKLAAAVIETGHPPHVVYANSTQSHLDNAYGRGKRRAREILSGAIVGAGGTVADVVLPNLFGEHGRPHYNSFVATFAHELANGRDPVVTENRKVPLLHAQAAAEALMAAATRRETHLVEPQGEQHSVEEVLGMLREFHAKYSVAQIPALSDQFAVDLFNTYRSHLVPERFPIGTEVHADDRGELFEAVRCHGGTGQTFVSTTNPGRTRGEHYHLSKIERFFVVQGTAEIALRQVLGGEIVRFQVKGQEHAFVDMPTMWVHNITNVGDTELVTLFWTHQLLDPGAPDTYREPVVPEESAS